MVLEHYDVEHKYLENFSEHFVSRECIECCVLCVIVLDKVFCNGLLGIVCNGGLESVLEVTILGEGFVCIILMLKVVGIFGSDVFCA